MNTLSNFASWADIFILALEGAHAIQNFDLKELRSAYDLLVSYMYLVGRAMTCMWNEIFKYFVAAICSVLLLLGSMELPPY